MKPYTIIEHQSFGVDEICENANLQISKEKAKKFFDALGEFVKGKENDRFLKFYGKDRLKAQNYVGIIQTPYGTLEILPKCFNRDSLPQSQNEKKSNRLTPEEQQKQKDDKEKLKEFFKIENFQNQFSNLNENDFGISNFIYHKNPKTASSNFLLFCLKTLKNTPFKDSQLSSLHTQNTPLLDIFIQMFCSELTSLCQKGIRHDYIPIEQNRQFLKGKLLFKEQIRYNSIHKERFFTSSDEYLADIPPNRIIKATLLFLKNKATHHTTLTKLNHLLEAFESITPSPNPLQEFSSCTQSRHFAYYTRTLEWCKLFLSNQSFTPYSGANEAYALLFPMEKLFESYVAHMLRHASHGTLYTIHPQKSDKDLLHNEGGKPLFQMRVDLHIEIKDDNTTNNKKVIIADTKWKLLKKTNDKKHKIAQSDLYQLFAYAHYHQAEEAWLIYPKPYSPKKESNELEIIKAIEEWNENKYHYNRHLSKEHHIVLKILFAPLHFYP